MNKIFVTNNLQGRLSEFKYLLDYVKFDFSTDRLIILGNLLNNGPSQIELIDYLIDLTKISNNISVLYGDTEKMYVDAFINDDFVAEQKITRQKNVFYDYLDNSELRKKHMMFFVSLKENLMISNYFFSNKKELVENFYSVYAENDINMKDDILSEEGSLAVSFYKSVGLVEITTKKCYKI